MSSKAEGQWTQLGNSITNSGGADDIEDRTGYSISLSADGQTLAVAAPEFNTSRGQVRVYKLVGGVWTQLGNFLSGVTVNDYFGRSVSLSADGQMLAVGAYGYNSQRGQVKVYKLINEVWNPQGSAITGVSEGDFVGVSVSLSADGQRLAVGSPRIGTTGQTKVFQLLDGEWVQQGSTITGDAVSDFFGGKVALAVDGQTLVVSAVSSNANRGQVKVFRWVGGAWVQQGSAILGDTPEDQVGISVSLSADGQRLAVGASVMNSNAGRGQVKVYQLVGGIWTQQGSAITGAAQNDYIGTSVSLSSDGQTLATGAQGASSAQGEVRIYKLVDGAWTQKGRTLAGEAPRDLFGVSVKLSSDGKIVAIGAPGGIIYTGSSAPEKVFQFCDLPISITPASTTINAGSSLTLTAAGGDSYSWSTGQGTSAITVSPTSTTTYSVTATSGVCSATAATTVTVLPVEVADLVPLVFAQPTVLYGLSGMSLVIRVAELNKKPTTTPVTLIISKDPILSLSFNSTAVFVGGRPVLNSQWIFDDSSPDYYILTSIGGISGGSVLSLGLDGQLKPNSTKGILTISATVSGGGEAILNNNVDTDRIEYFPK